MKKIISWIKNYGIVLMFYVFLLLIGWMICIFSPRLNAVLMGIMMIALLMVSFGVICLLEHRIPSLDEKATNKRNRKIALLAGIVMFATFLGAMASRVSNMEVNAKLNREIERRLTRSEILLLEKGVLGGLLKSCWEKPDDSLYNNDDYRDGNKKYEEGKGQEAVNRYLLALSQAKNLPDTNIDKYKYISDIYLRLGFAYLQLNDGEKSIDVFCSAIEIYEKHPALAKHIAAYLMPAMIYAENNQFSEAYMILKKAIAVWRDEDYYYKEILYHKIYIDVLNDINKLTTETGNGVLTGVDQR